MGHHPRRVRFLVLFLCVSFAAALTAAAPASAYRKPTSAERKAITKAWKAKHRPKKGKKRTLTIDQIRVSQINSHYALVVFRKGNYGYDKTQYFKRQKPKTARLIATDSTGEQIWKAVTSLGKKLTGEMDPKWTVTYYTTSAEKDTKKFTDTCAQRHTSTGSFNWSSTWRGIELTLHAFEEHQADGTNSVSGSVDFAACHTKCSKPVTMKDPNAELSHNNIYYGGKILLGSPFDSSPCGLKEEVPSIVSAVAAPLPLTRLKDTTGAVSETVTQNDIYIGDYSHPVDCSPNPSLPCRETVVLSAKVVFTRE